MSKGQETRQRILERAVAMAAEVGLDGLSLGDLASTLQLSKSGLFAHFQSKQALMLAVLEAGAERFVQTVVVPALGEPRGEPRLRALFDRWLEWGKTADGGCLFVAAAAELDDRPGPVRDALVTAHRAWLATLGRAARIAVDEGHLRDDLDERQLAFDLHGLMLAFHLHHRLLGDGGAEARARSGFELVLAAARPIRRSQDR